MLKCCIPGITVFFHQVATVVMKTAQLVLSQFKKLFNVVNWEFSKVYPYEK